MAMFFKPANGWAGDVIPFYWRGDYHIFYLQDHRKSVFHYPDSLAHGPIDVTLWYHLVTRDFTGYQDHGLVLPQGSPSSQDYCMGTGCVIERDGLFHIFYTGINPALVKPQAVMHATSTDLFQWRKDDGWALYPDESIYEIADWRDPFVFWNRETEEYWMLLAARVKSAPLERRGCIALCRSTDLLHWASSPPFWSPGMYYTHECPDLFYMGRFWYLLYSEFSEEHVTHYRMSRNLSGPWSTPVRDAFDGRTFYAAKSVSDGARRFVIGWNPTKKGDADAGAWQWGGNLVVHEVVQRQSGNLDVKMPPELARSTAKCLDINPRGRTGRWDISSDAISADAADGFAWCQVAAMPDQCTVTATISWHDGIRTCGLLLRVDDELTHYYQVRLEPHRQRVVFDKYQRPATQAFLLERPIALKAGEEVDVTIILDGTVIAVYLNDAVALSARGYDHRGGSLGLFASEGKARFKRVALFG